MLPACAAVFCAYISSFLKYGTSVDSRDTVHSCISVHYTVVYRHLCAISTPTRPGDANGAAQSHVTVTHMCMAYDGLLHAGSSAVLPAVSSLHTFSTSLFSPDVC